MQISRLALTGRRPDTLQSIVKCLLSISFLSNKIVYKRFPTENDVFGFSLKLMIWKVFQIRQSAFTNQLFIFVHYHITLSYNTDKHFGQTLRTKPPHLKYSFPRKRDMGGVLTHLFTALFAGYSNFLFIYCLQQRKMFLFYLSNSRFGKVFR